MITACGRFPVLIFGAVVSARKTREDRTSVNPSVKLPLYLHRSKLIVVVIPPETS